MSRRYRIVFSGGVSRSLVDWIAQLIPLLRNAPADTRVTVHVDRINDQEADDDSHRPERPG